MNKISYKTIHLQMKTLASLPQQNMTISESLLLYLAMDYHYYIDADKIVTS